MTKILAIISTHGNELLGPNLLAYMLAKRSKLLENIEFIIANPRAYAKNVRYTESDLNRSYGLGLDTYEGRRAKVIEERIRLLKPELVLDFHTTTAEQPDVLITADKNNEVVRRFINSSAIKDVLVVEPLNDITTVAPNFVAYEVSNSRLNDDLYKQICTDIERHLDGKMIDQERVFYKMVGKILPEEEQNIADLKNFAYNDTLQAIPAFLGEEAYKHDGTYAGFRLKADSQRHPGDKVTEIF